MNNKYIIEKLSQTSNIPQEQIQLTPMLFDATFNKRVRIMLNNEKTNWSWITTPYSWEEPPGLIDKREIQANEQKNIEKWKKFLKEHNYE